MCFTISSSIYSSPNSACGIIVGPKSM